LAITWVLAHQSRALLSEPSDLPHGNIFHPTPHAVLYGETATGALLYFLPVFALAGNPTLAINFTFLASAVLTAWSLHIVVKRWTGLTSAGVVAAGTFLATPWVLWSFMPCAPSHAVLQYLPWIMFLAAEPGGRSGTAALLALVVLQCLSNPYLACAVLTPLAVLTIARLLRRTTRARGLRLLTVLVLALVLIVPVYSGQLVSSIKV
jgi:hypothetical protein